MENTFGVNIIPDNDAERIAVLRRYQILDTPPEGAFDNVARLAAEIFNVPIALISLVDEEQVFFKANIGMGNAKVTSRGVSLCSLAILKPEVTVFENAPEEPCLLINPNVAGSFGLKFYAGAPLTTHDGFRIGTLCVIDKQPRKFSKADERVLQGLAKIVMDEVELRLAAITERDKQQVVNEEVSALNEELNSANEQQRILVDELSLAKGNLQVERDRLTRFFSQVPAGMCVLDGPRHTYELVNADYQKLFPGRQLFGLPVVEALPELKGTAIVDILDKVYSTGEAYGANALLIPLAYSSGGPVEDRYFNFIYQPRLDVNNRVDGILALVFEVTEQAVSQKKIEELNAELNNTNQEFSAINEELTSLNEEYLALNESLHGLNDELQISKEQLFRGEELMRFAIEAANVGTWYINASTREFLPSIRLKELFGYEANEEMPYDAAIDKIAESHRQAVISAVEAAVLQGSAYDIEYPILGYHDHRLRWVRAFGKLYPDSQGVLTHFSGVMIDITEQKADDQRKNDFIGMVSHELKTPLTSLSAYIQMLHGRSVKLEDSFTSGALDKASTQIKKMTAMINGFLNLSRFESGKIHLNKHLFDLEELVEEVETEIKLTTSSHYIVFARCNKVIIDADRDKIGQVINNLLSNAIKYSTKGTEVNLNCEIVNDAVLISVKDNGMGVKPEDIEKLFDRYYRVENVNTSTISGFGLGLYLSAEIIKRHEGKIWVESEYGKGSTFYFSLPLSD